MYKYYQDLVLGWNYLEEEEILKNGVRLIIEDQIIYSIQKEEINLKFSKNVQIISRFTFKVGAV